MQVTIAICTRNRPAPLERCLAAIGDPGCNAEILVVDNGSDPDATLQLASRFRTRYVREERVGLEFARNRAVANSRGDEVLFTDDDCEPQPGWIEAIRDAFVDQDVVGVFGKTIVPDSATRSQRDFEGLKREWPYLERTVTQEVIHSFWYLGVIGVGANMAFRREFLLACGGFPPSAYSASDDDYMAIHALLSGRKLRYTPNAAVIQHHRKERAEITRRMFEYGACTARMVWYLGKVHRRFGLALVNQLWLLFQNLRQAIVAVICLRMHEAVFRIAYIVGLSTGFLDPVGLGRKVEADQKNRATGESVA